MPVVNPHVHTEQEILNSSFNETYGVLVTIPGTISNGAVVTESSSVLGGASANGTRDLTVADTWYSVPSTVPTSPYVLVVTIENALGDVRFGFDNTGTPSATNGNIAPSQLTLKLAASQVVYYSSTVSGDDVNWTTKII